MLEFIIYCKAEINLEIYEKLLPSHIFADRKRRRYFRLFRETRDIRNSSNAGSTRSTCTVQNNDEFKQSVILLNKIRELSNPPGSENQIAFQLSKETEGKIITNSREGIRLGKLVSDEYLDSIFPELWLHDCVALNETSPQGYSPL